MRHRFRPGIMFTFCVFHKLSAQNSINIFVCSLKEVSFQKSNYTFSPLEYCLDDSDDLKRSCIFLVFINCKKNKKAW